MTNKKHIINLIVFVILGLCIMGMIHTRRKENYQCDLFVQLGGNITGTAILDDPSEWSVSLSANGQRMAVGEPYARVSDGDGLLWSGRVRVFDWSKSTNKWVQIGAEIKGRMVDGRDKCGFSVSLSGNGQRLAVGSPGIGRAGMVQMFEWSGISWGQIGVDIVEGTDGELDIECGYSVSLSTDGMAVAVGSPGKDNNRGRVRVYKWVTTGYWVWSTWIVVKGWAQSGDTTIDGEDAGDRAGHSVSLSADGQNLAVGAPSTSWPAGKGNVRGFYLDASNKWKSMGDPIYGQDGSQYGTSVSLSADGTRVAVGAPLHNGGGGAYCGLVRVFDAGAVGAGGAQPWVQMGLDIDGEAVWDRFGHSVSLSANGQKLAVGAPASVTASSRGYVTVFAPATEARDTEWLTVQTESNGTIVGGIGHGGQRRLFGVALR